MQRLFIFVIGMLVAGTLAARYADHAITSPSPQAAVVEPAYDPRQPSTSGRSLTLDADRWAHFQVDGRIDGRHLDFLVDTGASLVVLRESDAAQAGIRPQRG